MIEMIAPNIWHVTHHFVAMGLAISSRMTIVRLAAGGLWLHSPVPLSRDDMAEIAQLGEVQYIVAPNKMHHLFVVECLAAFPRAQLFGAPGLLAKRPDLKDMQELRPSVEPDWAHDLDQIFFAGMPLGNETVWFHRLSKTLIVTDLCQWWSGELSFRAAMYASITGVRKRLAVPRTVRLIIKDHQAARTSAQKILAWPFERVVMAHNAILETDAHAAVEKAFACLRK